MTSRTNSRRRKQKQGDIYQGPSFDLSKKPYMIKPGIEDVKQYESKEYVPDKTDILKVKSDDILKVVPKEVQLRVYEHDYMDVLLVEAKVFGRDNSKDRKQHEILGNNEAGPQEVQKQLEMSRKQLGQRRDTLRPETKVRIQENLNF